MAMTGGILELAQEDTHAFFLSSVSGSLLGTYE